MSDRFILFLMKDGLGSAGVSLVLLCRLFDMGGVGMRVDGSRADGRRECDFEDAIGGLR